MKDPKSGKTIGWKAVVSAIDPLTGKRIRPTKRATTKEAARGRLKELQEEYLGRSNYGTNMTVKELFDDWLEHDVKPNLSPSTHYNYKNQANKYILPKLGNLKIVSVKPSHIKAIIAPLTEGSRTRQSVYIVANMAFKQAFLDELIESNPCARVRRPKYERDLPRPFLKKQTNKILKTVSSDTMKHAICRYALAYGPRQCELFGLKWSKIDFEQGTIRIDWELIEVAGKVVEKSPKTIHSIRTNRVDAKLLGLLNKLRSQVVADGTYADDGFVFQAREGGPIRRSNWSSRFWRPLLKKLKIDHRGFHHCRHTACTDMLNDRIPANKVAGIVGHANGEITLSIYGHFISSEQEDVVKSVRSRHG